MGLFPKKDSAGEDESEKRVRDLRRMMQDIVIAHAMVCYKHMTPEQLEAAREEWARVVKGKGWAPFFADDDAPLPAARVLTPPERR
jgi:hypothetical protein